jgi:hypothetical protein
MPTRLQTTIAVLLAILASLTTSAVNSQVVVAYSGVMGCELGCNFIASGWPFPYIVDHPGISPTGSVSLVGAILGVDIIRPGHFLGTVLFWLVPSGLGVVAVSRVRGRHAK